MILQPFVPFGEYYLYYFNFVLIQERQWTSPGMSTALQAAINSSQSDRLKQALNMTPRFLYLYFAVALRDINDCMSGNAFYFPYLILDLQDGILLKIFVLFVAALVCALIPIIMSRNSYIFPDKTFAFEVG